MKVSDHAINRFRERTGSKQSDDIISDKLIKFAEQGKPATFNHPRHELYALFNHNFKEAEYMWYNGFIVVIVDDEVKTVHNNEAKRWVVI